MSNQAGQSPVRAICIMGPTAAGKTDVAIELATDLPVELISVDSAQIYRGMNIGTAKPPADVLASFPHRLIDIRDPWERYSAGSFARDATAAMLDISARGKLPVLVGGTMLYFHALQTGLADLPSADPDLRAQLDMDAAQAGWPAMHKRLAVLDPVTASRLKPTDAQRIQRALEVCLTAGEPLSELQRTTAPLLAADYLNIGLLPSDRASLHERIELRLQAMLAAGFVAELERLAALPGMSRDVAAMRAVGYRQFWPHMANEISLQEATDKAVVATRRLAKRQLTWLRSWPNLQVVDCLKETRAADVRKLADSWFRAGATT